MWGKASAFLKENLWEHEQLVKARAQFSELDRQTQSYILIGGFAAFVLILILTFFILWARVIVAKSDVAELDELIQYVQNSAVRIEELKAEARTQSVDPLLDGLDIKAAGGDFLEKVAAQALIPKTGYEVGSSKGAQHELKLIKVSLTQVMRVLYMIEQSGAKASVELLKMDSKDDQEGYIWADLVIQKK
jgi:hypothetical protein